MKTAQKPRKRPVLPGMSSYCANGPCQCQSCWPIETHWMPPVMEADVVAGGSGAAVDRNTEDCREH